nr:RsmD family RNA methyltransferase [Candidatus Enterousia merdequi]
MKSNLQIISGKYRGKKLVLPSDARPTQNMARGAIFNMLTDVIDTTKQISIWDVFAGSGAFGLECLSRFNNPKVVFTDIAKSSIDTVKKNLNAINEVATVELCDAISVISKFGVGSDLVFIDPPYPDFNFGVLFVKKLAKVIKSGTVLIWEFESDKQPNNLEDNWEIVKDKTYGRARFLFLIKK